MKVWAISPDKLKYQPRVWEIENGGGEWNEENNCIPRINWRKTLFITVSLILLCKRSEPTITWDSQGIVDSMWNIWNSNVVFFVGLFFFLPHFMSLFSAATVVNNSAGHRSNLNLCCLSLPIPVPKNFYIPEHYRTVNIRQRERFKEVPFYWH